MRMSARTHEQLELHEDMCGVEAADHLVQHARVAHLRAGR